MELQLAAPQAEMEVSRAQQLLDVLDVLGRAGRASPTMRQRKSGWTTGFAQLGRTRLEATPMWSPFWAMCWSPLAGEIACHRGHAGSSRSSARTPRLWPVTDYAGKFGVLAAELGNETSTEKRWLARLEVEVSWLGSSSLK